MVDLALLIHVNGVVQGVGFRPFVYRIARAHNLRGYVKNLGDAGVEILVDGEEKDLMEFVREVRERAPPLSRVEDMKIVEVDYVDMEEFKILPSETGDCNGGNSVIPPDVAICDDCLRELFDPKNPRYMYPFIVCTNCGPRFSIIESLPYDRDNTSMRDFPMCDFCLNEYRDPMNRRYHAEPVCCNNCGPKYWLTDSSGNIIEGDPISKTAEIIDSGGIVAIKGIGGFHLACDATNPEVVQELRNRLGRESQPFALMASDMDVVRSISYVTDMEMEELKSYRRPIVLLRKRYGEMDYIAPGLHTLGVMLPYAPVHHLLFHHSRSKLYVMTSANLPDRPMVKDNERVEEIMGVADYFLLHNRRIVNRVDDSVIRFVAGERAVIRRSRGFVPLPFDIPFSYSGLSMGAELMNSFSVIREGRVYTSQYIGNTSRLDVLQFMSEAVNSMLRIVPLKRVDAVVVDSHPHYGSGKLGREIAEENGVEALKIQHHFAHVASVMAEKSLKESVGIAVDAVGYGSDGRTWGGEVLSITGEGLKRFWHISYFPLPGGDLASHFPLRALMGLLSLEFSMDEVESTVRRFCPRAIESLPYGESEFGMILQQIERGINIQLASSTGRVLDAVSVLLNVAYRRTYEGEPAMKLETLALNGKEDLKFTIPLKGRRIDASSLLAQIIDSRARESDVALSVHLALARAFAQSAADVAESQGIRDVVVSGGVAYNSIIVGEIGRILGERGLRMHVSSNVPRGDNGISVGQAFLAGMYLEGIIDDLEVKE